MAKTHDYTARTWGHDYTVMAVREGGQRLQVTGWGRGIVEGDYLILQQPGGSTRYQVSSISYRLDPSDMWTAALHFAPRTKEGRGPWLTQPAGTQACARTTTAGWLCGLPPALMHDTRSADGSASNGGSHDH